MIKTETITINNKTFYHTYSNLGYLVQSADGNLYSDAYDIVRKTYIETDEIDPDQKELLYSEAVNALVSNLDDEQALNSPILFNEWDMTKTYNAGDRVLYNSTLFKVLQTHEAQETWTPSNSPSLFAEILAGQGGTEIGEWSQPDSTNPYMTGDKVLYNGKTYVSTIDNNVWAPTVYGWDEVV